MRAKISILVPVLLVLAGCITEESYQEQAVATRDNFPGPLERAQAQVRQRIARLPQLYGPHLLRTMQLIIGYKNISSEPVIEALPKADPRTQANLIYILGFVGGDPAHAAILPYINSPDASIRFEAAAALVNQGDWGGIPTLLAFMDSNDRRLRYKAADALKSMVKKDFGYQFDAPVPERDKALARWKAWWDGRRSALIYGAGETSGSGEGVASTTGND